MEHLLTVAAMIVVATAVIGVVLPVTTGRTTRPDRSIADGTPSTDEPDTAGTDGSPPRQDVDDPAALELAVAEELRRGGPSRW